MSDLKAASEEDRKKSQSVQSIPFISKDSLIKRLSLIWAVQVTLYFAWISSPVTFAVISMTIGKIFEISGIHKLIHPQPSVLQEPETWRAAVSFIPNNNIITLHYYSR